MEPKTSFLIANTANYWTTTMTQLTLLYEFPHSDSSYGSLFYFTLKPNLIKQTERSFKIGRLTKFYLDSKYVKCGIAQWLAFALPVPAAPGSNPRSFSEMIFREKIVDVADVNCWRCLEQWTAEA